jgi:hypothetical protein
VICSVQDCGLGTVSKGLCRKHYQADWVRRNPGRMRAINRKHGESDAKRVYRLKYLYNTTPHEWETTFIGQGCKCPGCGKSLKRGARGTHTDHSHATGKFRGILCFTCNMALGNAKDSPAILRNLLEYLQPQKYARITSEVLLCI